MPAYRSVKDAFVEASNAGLLLAIGALGLSTSVRTILGLGWRHIITVVATTVVILVSVTAGLLVIQAGS